MKEVIETVAPPELATLLLLTPWEARPARCPWRRLLSSSRRRLFSAR